MAQALVTQSAKNQLLFVPSVNLGIAIQQGNTAAINQASDFRTINDTAKLDSSRRARSALSAASKEDLRRVQNSSSVGSTVRLTSFSTLVNTLDRAVQKLRQAKLISNRSLLQKIAQAAEMRRGVLSAEAEKSKARKMQLRRILVARIRSRRHAMSRKQKLLQDNRSQERVKQKAIFRARILAKSRKLELERAERLSKSNVKELTAAILKRALEANRRQAVLRGKRLQETMRQRSNTSSTGGPLWKKVLERIRQQSTLRTESVTRFGRDYPPQFWEQSSSVHNNAVTTPVSSNSDETPNVHQMISTSVVVVESDRGVNLAEAASVLVPLSASSSGTIRKEKVPVYLYLPQLGVNERRLTNSTRLSRGFRPEELSGDPSLGRAPGVPARDGRSASSQASQERREARRRPVGVDGSTSDAPNIVDDLLR